MPQRGTAKRKRKVSQVYRMCSPVATKVGNLPTPPTLEELSDDHKFGINEAVILERVSGKQASLMEVIVALQKARGWISIAAQLLDMTQVGLRKRIREHPELKQWLVDIREHWLDQSEIRLFRAIDAGDQRAIEFHLLTQGKHRGWVKNFNMLLTPNLGTVPAIPLLESGQVGGDIEHSPGGLDAGVPPQLHVHFVTEINVNAPSGTNGIVTAEERSGAVQDTREV